MGKTDIFTREPCTFAVEAGIATATITSGETSFKLIMPVAVLIENYAACGDALEAWAQTNGAEVAKLSKRGPLFLRERHN